MLNERLACIPLFCAHDIDAVMDSATDEMSYLLKETGMELLSANQIGEIVLGKVEQYLQSAVEDMSEMRK